MKKIEDYAKVGEHQDVMKALELLTTAYIDMCGVSLGFRTVVYCAAEAWQERLAWMDLPLSEIARREPFVCLMPHISSDYDPEYYDRYDITGMDEEELLHACRQIIAERTFDEATNEVLCWGILKAPEEKKELSQEIEATAPDGTTLKGILTEQSCSGTWMTMTEPYDQVSIWKDELVRDAKSLLVQGYEDYLHLRSQENEIRALYLEYQEALRKHKNDSAGKKYSVFNGVYNKIIDDLVIACPEKLFHEWFGMEFFDIFAHKDPSWM